MPWVNPVGHGRAHEHGPWLMAMDTGHVFFDCLMLMAMANGILADGPRIMAADLAPWVVMSTGHVLFDCLVVLLHVLAQEGKHIIMPGVDPGSMLY